MQHISIFLFTFIFAILINSYSFSQNTLPYIVDTISLDGNLNEQFWETIPTYSNFKMKFPVDSGLAKYDTEVKIAYDAKGLILSAKCYFEENDKIVLQSLKRDYSFPVTDAFAIFIDPFNDKTNGYSFSVNPYGSQREGALQNGGQFGVTTAWDQAWYSATKIYDSYWIAEMKIPFNCFKYNEDLESWGINFARNYLSANETSVYSRVPLQQNVANMAFNEAFNWQEPLQKIGKNVTFIPYQTFGNAFDYQVEGNGFSKDNLAKVGIDAKIGVGSGLNLDITVNPDFSQIEVDRQVTNLTRFSLFFPEKRNFFLENADLFSDLGFRNINPLFTRKIGLQSGQAIPISHGFRLSGKVDENWRIGAMHLMQNEVASLNLEQTAFNVLIAQRKVLARSNLTFFNVNKKSIQPQGSNPKINEDYNKVFGGNFTYRSENGKLNSKSFYSLSNSENKVKKNNAYGISNNYRSVYFDVDINFERVEDNYNAETGFVPRLQNYDALLKQTFNEGYLFGEFNIHNWFYPEDSKVLRHGFGIEQNTLWYDGFDLNENSFHFHWGAEFKSGASIEPGITWINTDLKYNVDVLRVDTLTTYLIGKYKYWFADINYTSDRRNKFYINLVAETGTFYNGNKTGFNAELTYRPNKNLNFEVYYQKDLINYPILGKNERFNFDLFGLNNLISFSPTVYLSNYIQFNRQADVININSRFQWRFRPMSDIFLVYTDNYDSFLNVKNRAIVLKMIFWLRA